MRCMKVRSVPLAAGVLVAALALSACGSDDDEGGTGGSAAAKDYEVAHIVALEPPNGFVAAQMCGVKQAAEDLGVKVEFQGPSKFDASELVMVLNAVVASRPDAIIIDPTDAQVVSAPLAAAARSGIKVVAVNGPPADKSIIESAVVTDNEQGGQQAGEAMAKVLNGKGKVVTISLVPSAEGLSKGPSRQSGFSDVVKEQPGMEYLGVQYTNNDPVKAAQVTSALIARHPDLAGIYLPAPVDSAGVFNALRSADKAGKIKVVAYDPREDLVEEMRQGNIAAFVAQDVRREGRLGLEYAVQSLNKKRVPENTVLPNFVVYEEDLKDPNKQQYLYKGC